MASGTINGSTSNQYIDAKIVWSSRVSSNAALNQSTVTATLYYKRNNTGFTTSGTGTFTINVGGSKTTVTKTLNIAGDEWVEAVSSGNIVISHLSDGTRSITISASGSIPDTTLTSTSVSGTAKLDPIPKESTIESLSCATRYFNGEMTYKYTVWNVSYFNRCNISLNLNGEYIAVKSVLLGRVSGLNGQQFTSTVTLSKDELATIYNNLPSDSIKGTLRFTFRTYNDSAYSQQIGSASYKEISLNIPDNTDTKPTATMTLKAVNDLPSPFNTLYIEDVTMVDADFTDGEGSYGATITSYRMSAAGGDYGSPYTSGYLTTSGIVTVKGTVTNSRGFSREYTEDIVVIPYSKPKVSPASGEGSIICARCDADGNLSDSGTYLKIKAKRSYSLCTSNGEQQNFCGLRYRYKKVTDSAYSSWITLLGAKTLTTEEVDTVQMNGGLDAASSYIVHVDAVDLVGYHQYVKFDIPTDDVFMDWSGEKKTIGLGKYAERENALDSNWDFYMNNHRVTGLPTPTGNTDAVPKSYVDPADVKLSKSLNAIGWYKVGTLSGEMCAVATLTVGGIFVNNQASPSMVDIATQYNQARTFLRLPSLADGQISKIGVVKESMKVYGVYAYYNTANENTVDINIHIHMGAFVSADLVVASVTDSDMLSSINIKQ